MSNLPSTKSFSRNLKTLAERGAFPGSSAFCFYCGVDSKPLIVLFLTTLGFAILGSVCIFFWSVATGQWNESESPKYKILEAESDELNRKD
jgi:cbb3-type cytochrome oxidase maturation protein